MERAVVRRQWWGGHSSDEGSGGEGTAVMRAVVEGSKQSHSSGQALFWFQVPIYYVERVEILNSQHNFSSISPGPGLGELPVTLQFVEQLASCPKTPHCGGVLCCECGCTRRVSKDVMDLFARFKSADKGHDEGMLHSPQDVSLGAQVLILLGSPDGRLGHLSTAA